MKTIAIYNLKGGVGKTATAVNLAYLSAQCGYRTCLWDLDPQAAASWYLSSKPRGGFKFSKLAKDKISLGKQIQATEHQHLDIIPSDISYRNIDVQLSASGSKLIREWLASLSEIYRVVILDCPPSLSSLAESILKQADVTIIPALPTYLSFRTYKDLMGLLKEKKIHTKRFYPVITMIDRRKKIHCEFAETSQSKLGKTPIGYIPYCSDVEKMGEFRKPIAAFAPRSVATLAYKLMWENVEKKLK